MSIEDCRNSWLKANSSVDLPALSRAFERSGFAGCAGPFQMTGLGPRFNLQGLSDDNGPLAVRVYDLELELATENGSILDAHVNVYDDAITDNCLVSHEIPSENYPAFIALFQTTVTHALQGFRCQHPDLVSGLGDLVRRPQTVQREAPCFTPVAA